MIRHSAKAIENEELSAQYFSSLSHSMWCPVRTILTAGCGTNRGVVGPVVGVGSGFGFSPNLGVMRFI